MRVLFGIDGSESTRHAVEFLVKRKHLLGPTPDITCVLVEMPMALRAVGVFGADPGMPPLPAIEPETIVEPVLQLLRDGGLSPSLEVREGDAGLEISQLAQDGGFELIVLGAHKRGLLKRAVLGSTTTKVLSHCSVPVLIAR
jgi:nucleotide-binding universal stress UspA family protein